MENFRYSAIDGGARTGGTQGAQMNGGRGENGTPGTGPKQAPGIWPHAVAGLGAGLVTALVLGVAAEVPVYANVAEPTNSPSPSVHTVVEPDGTVTVTVSGTWEWTTLKGATASRPCDSRFGAGWAVAWHDPKDHGYQLSTLSASVTVHVGSTGVNPANTDHRVSYDTTDPCGTFTQTDSPAPGDGTVSGTWTGTHTYSSVSSMPPSVCVVTFDVTGNSTRTGPDPSRLLFTNTDNSVADALAGGGTWDTTPGGPNCLAVSATTTTTPTTPTTTTTTTTPTTATTTTQPVSSPSQPSSPPTQPGPVSPSAPATTTSASLAFTGVGPGLRLLAGAGVGLVVFGGGLLLTRRRRHVIASSS